MESHSTKSPLREGQAKIPKDVSSPVERVRANHCTEQWIGLNIIVRQNETCRATREETPFSHFFSSFILQLFFSDSTAFSTTPYKNLRIYAAAPQAVRVPSFRSLKSLAPSQPSQQTSETSNEKKIMQKEEISCMLVQPAELHCNPQRRMHFSYPRDIIALVARINRPSGLGGRPCAGLETTSTPPSLPYHAFFLPLHFSFLYSSPLQHDVAGSLPTRINLGRCTLAVR